MSESNYRLLNFDFGMEDREIGECGLKIIGAGLDFERGNKEIWELA